MAELVADIASYQPSDLGFFQALKNAGVKAVVVKLTEGSNPGSAYVNPKARAQIANARQVGLLVHAYHYAKFYGAQDARNEADWFVQNAKALGIGADSVMTLDIEDTSNARYATDDANAFLQRVKDLGYPNIDIYSMASWFWQGRLDPSRLIAKNKWVANYGVSQPGVDAVGLWQYTSSFPIYGVKIDMSYDFNGFYSRPHSAQPIPVKTPETPKPIKVPNSWVDPLGDKWTKEDGTFTSTTALHLRWGARTTSSVIAVLPTGSVVKYDAYSRHGDFVWLRQPRPNGQYGYVACRDAKTNEAYGTFK